MTAKKTTKTVKPATAKPSAQDSADAIEATVVAGKETVDTVVKAGTDAAAQGVEKAVAMSQEQIAAAVKTWSS